jgi:CBS domain-containing protein
VTLADLLSPRRVVVPLAAATWAEGIRLLLAACVADGRVRDPAKLDRVVRAAWPADTLTLGPHAFLPHFRTDAVDSVVVALGVSPAPMVGANPETHGARIMLLVIAPPKEAASYLQTVAAFARALAQPDMVDALHAAASAEAVLALPSLGEISLEGQLLVRDIMASMPLTLDPELSLEQAARLLLSHGADAMPVVGPAREVLGILSLRELLRFLVPAYVQRVQTGQRRAVRRAGPAAEPRVAVVRDAMLRNVLCVSEDEAVAEVATLLANKDVSCVPVVRDGALTGVLTRTDVVRKLVGGTAGGGSSPG